MLIRILGWNLLRILQKKRIWNTQDVFLQVKMRMTYFDSPYLFLEFDLQCQKRCSCELKPHSPILDSDFFWGVKVSAQGHEFLCPGPRVSARTKKRISGVFWWFLEFSGGFWSFLVVSGRIMLSMSSCEAIVDFYCCWFDFGLFEIMIEWFASVNYNIVLVSVMMRQIQDKNRRLNREYLFSEFKKMSSN